MEPQLSEYIKNIYIKKPDCRSDKNFFIAHTIKRDLKNNGLDYNEISGKDLLNEMVNGKLTDIGDIISAWEQVKAGYKNDISENVASKSQNTKQDKPVGYRDYDMADTHGNRIYSKGATVYLKLAKGETRKLGVIDPKEKVFAIKRERAKHLFRKFNAYGFNHHFFSTPTNAFDKILLEDDYGKYLFPVKKIIKDSSYLHFLGRGFERQVFLKLNIIETFKQEDDSSIEEPEEKSQKK